jgi:hypothetical protein
MVLLLLLYKPIAQTEQSTRKVSEEACSGKFCIILNEKVLEITRHL